MNNIDREKRAADLDAILPRGKYGLQSMGLRFCGKGFFLRRSPANADYAYMLSEGEDFGKVVAVEGVNQSGTENAMVSKMPNLVIYLDESLNIIRTTGSGKPLSKDTIEQIIDQMLEEHAAARLRGLP